MNEITLMTEEHMSSRQIAELTGKLHAHVMRDIRELLDQGVAESNFGLGSYKDLNNQERPEYQLTKKGCLILASGYDTVLRERIIDRWEELEQQQRQASPSYIISDPIARAKAWIREEEERQLLLSQQAEQAKKIEQATSIIGKLTIENVNIKSIISEQHTLSVGDLAKACGYKIGPNQLFKFLRDKGVLTKSNKPNQNYINNQWLDYRSNEFGKFTPIVRYKGIVGIIQMLADAGIEEKPKDPVITPEEEKPKYKPNSIFSKIN